MKKYYIVNGERRTVREFHLFKVTICVYHKCKHAEKRIQVNRDRFFGTGTTILVALPF